jgi:hypothetical protein
MDKQQFRAELLQLFNQFNVLVYSELYKYEHDVIVFCPMEAAHSFIPKFNELVTKYESIMSRRDIKNVKLKNKFGNFMRLSIWYMRIIKV